MRNITLIEKIVCGEFNERFLDIYGDEKMLGYQKSRYLKAIDKFQAKYGEADIEVYSAPGRSEIGGNHTDHQHGEVLAASINLDTIGIVAKTDDNIVRIVSDGYEEIVLSVDNLELVEKERETTIALVKGVLKGLKDRGYKVGGFKAYVTSDVLVGAGLSSSAAYETLIGTIISGLYNEMSVPATEIAIIGEYAENVYFGKPCGLMDQMACSVGNMAHIDFSNPKEPVVKTVDFDMNKYGYSLCITDTKCSHADLTEDYAAVPKEMKNVANYFGREVLRGITKEMLLESVSDIREKFGDRAVLRALHFITENERVKKEVEALKSEDVEGFLEEFKKSADSSYKYLQNIYSNKDVRHQNVSVALGFSDTFLGEDGVSRVHGGGFAGTMQAFVKSDRVDAYKKYMDSIFGEGSCVALKIRKYGGMKVF